MPLCRVLSAEFTSSTRSRGDEDAESDRVTILTGSPTAVDARVRGTAVYRVAITREEAHGLHFDASCECPFCIDQLTPCEHIWATLRLAERFGYLGDATDGRSQAPLTLFGASPLPCEDDAPGAPAPGGRDARERRTSVVPAHAPARPTPSTRFLTSLSSQLGSHETAETAYRYAGGELLYVFDVEHTLAQQGLALRLMFRKPNKTGGWSKPTAAPISAQDLALAPETDRRLLAPLIGATRVDGSTAARAYDAPSQEFSTFTLADALARDLLPALARTGRAHVKLMDAGAPVCPVRWDDGPPWTFRVEVAPVDAGMRLSGVFTRPNARLAARDPVLATAPGFLFTRDAIARLDTGIDFALVAALRTSGPIDVPTADLSTLAYTLARAGVPDTDLPGELRIGTVDVSPTPRARLRPLTLSTPDAGVEIEVDFNYDGSVVPSTGPATVFDAERRRVVRRRLDEEREHVNRLTACVRTGWDPDERRSRLEIAAKDVPRVVTTLLADGWRVEGRGHQYHAAGAVSLSVTSGIDWFDLHATVTFGDQTLELGEALAALKRGERMVRLGDGSTGLLPAEWLKRYLPLAAAAAMHTGRLRFRHAQAALLDALLADAAEHATVAFDAGFTRAQAELADAHRLAAIDPPASFTGTLRDYQRDGLGWMTFLQRVGWGGCLADDMGLGKTVMVLALLESRRTASHAGAGRRPSLVVVPRSLVPNWIAEAKRFTPSLRVLDYSAADRRAADAELTTCDLALITYGTLRRDAVRLKDVDFDYVILDEAQAIKNATTTSAKAARLLRARHRLALSGTPIENHLGELWSLFEFLNPGLLGGSTLFRRATKVADDGARHLLTRALRPFILRRTKAEVAKDLPARTEQTISCELSDRERALYDGLRKHFRRSVLDRVGRVGLKQAQMHILEALLRLRQAACHPGLIVRARLGESSAKLDVLLPRLAEIVEEGHKALVFSQFTSFLAIVRDRLDQQKVTYEYLDGKTKKRGPKVERFQTDPDCRLFLVSLKAGGLGLNLTAAEYVFLLDPWWNPAVEAQAIDRAHRIGQTREVFACRLIARDTVEEKILELQRTKRDLADAILSAGATTLRHLEREDLELLFS